MTSTRLAILASCLALLPGFASAQVDMPPRPELYKFVMIQAAPGKLPDLLAAYRDRAPVMAVNGDEAPIVVRHSQGDRWDLLVVYPIGSFTTFYSAERMARRDAGAIMGWSV